MHTQAMLGSHPHVAGRPDATLIRCIEECFSCAQACTSCADACLGEDMVADLARCIRLDMDCADICLTTGKVASRRTEASDAILVSMLDACAAICRLCAEECETHAQMHEHCRICAEACRRCESICHDVLRVMRQRLQ
jgi:hypothetical protein